MVRDSTGRRVAAERLLRVVVCSAAAAGALMITVAATQDAVADGDTRTLTFYHTHRGDTTTITFRRDGRYDEQGLAALNWYLRDWRTNEVTRMDPELFDVLWEVYRASGSHGPINIISSYRSPTTNGMLRSRSRGVAEHSQHMLGKAMDIRLPDVSIEHLRAIAMRMQYGGVGYYPSSQFVHVDTGRVRAWPRMSQDQLARLFPDGKTLHLPSSGRPLAGYAEAKAEILPRNAALAAQAADHGHAIDRTMVAALHPQENAPAAAPMQVASATAEIPFTPPPPAPIPPQRPKDLLLAAMEPAPPRPARPIVTASVATPTASFMEPIIGPDREASVRVLFDPRSAFLDLGFSSPRPRLSTARFSGPAVAPLPMREPSLMRQANAAPSNPRS